MELTELIHELVASIYLMYYISAEYEPVEALIEEGQIDWEEVQELQTDGSRFLLKSWDGEASCWISYDDTALSLDMDFSSPEYVFLDLADGSNYVGLHIEYSDFYTVYQEREEFNQEYRGTGGMTELQTSEKDGVELMYSVGEFADEGSSIKELIFGIDLSEDCCVVGEIMYSPEDMTDEQMAELTHQVIAGIELPEETE